MAKSRNLLRWFWKRISQSFSPPSDPSSPQRLEDAVYRDLGTLGRNLNIQGAHDDAIIIMGAFGREEEGVTADIWMEYESFWVEEGKVCWKFYDAHGPIVVRMRITILMEGLLGEPDLLERMFASKGQQ
jgi:hypothetical protein